jgi:hypothetical protein
MAVIWTEPDAVLKSRSQPLPLPVRPASEARGSSAKQLAEGRKSAFARTTLKAR